MIIPAGKSGFATISPTGLRTFGAGGFLLEDQEQPRGCPRKFDARYVRGIPDEPTDAMAYGLLLHRVWEITERDGRDPYDVLVEQFPADMDPARMVEARHDLDEYLARESSPLDDMHTVGVELDWEAPLYIDDEHGPVWFRAILDLVKVDPEQPNVVHVVDYKSNRRPPARSALRGDVQLMGQAWLAHHMLPKMFPGAGPPVVWSHLDAIKWRNVTHQYSRADLDNWHMWAVSVCRTILRDDDPQPRVNAGCPNCVVRHDCPAYTNLPTYGAALVRELEAGELADRIAWRDTAAATRTLLDNVVKQVDAEIAALVHERGELVAGGHRWTQEAKWETVADARRLADLLGDHFWYVINVIRGRVKEVCADLPASERAQVESCFEQVAAGIKVVRSKAD